MTDTKPTADEMLDWMEQSLRQHGLEFVAFSNGRIGVESGPRWGFGMNIRDAMTDTMPKEAERAD